MHNGISEGLHAIGLIDTMDRKADAEQMMMVREGELCHFANRMRYNH